VKLFVKRLALPVVCVLGLLFAAPALAGTNLIGNPGFETDTSGWNTSGSTATVTLVQDSTSPHSGSYDALLSATTSGSCGLNDSPDWVHSTSTGTYTGSIWVLGGTPGTPVNVRFREYANGTGTYLGGATSTVTLSTSWQQLTVSYKVASPGSSTLDFNAYVPAAYGTAGICFYADDASIVLVSPAVVPIAAARAPRVMVCLASPHMRMDGSLGTFFDITGADWTAGVDDPSSFLYQSKPAIYVQGYGTMCQLSDLVTYGGDPSQYAKADYPVNGSGIKTPAGVTDAEWGAIYDYYVKP
jgi:Carbohydrate binding domain